MSSVEFNFDIVIMFTPTHSRRVSSVATTVGYVSATEGTEGSEGSALSPDIDEEEEEEELEEEFGPSIATIRPMADEESSTESLELDEEEEEPLVGRRRDEEKSLFGVSAYEGWAHDSLYHR